MPFERSLERFLFASRWLLAPLYIGLALALLLLIWVFLLEVVHLIGMLPHLTQNDAILGLLSLIDLSLAGNLVLIVIFSGYENFVSKMDLGPHEDRPSWQGKVDFSALKLKLIASIVAISGIHLLKVFMDIGKYSDRDINYMMILHGVFVGSGVFLAAMDWLASHTTTFKDH